MEARLELPPWKPWCPGVASDEAVLELRSGIVLAEAVVCWLNKPTLLTSPSGGEGELQDEAVWILTYTRASPPYRRVW